MGIKKFFGWLNKNHSECILNDLTVFQPDTLLFDMNGFFHPIAQLVFRYHNHKTDKFIVRDNFTTRKKYFQAVCGSIDTYVNAINPKKYVVMCVDGCAPVSKQNQMRSRRVRKNEHAEQGGFDSNQISVGTEFMHHLTIYIDNWIKRKVTEDERWRSLKVIFSNEKVAGEGEHKLIRFIRAHDELKHCLVGADADLIVLSMFTDVRNIHILREDNRTSQPFYVDIDCVSEAVFKHMKWNDPDDAEDPECDPRRIVNDFVFLSFLVGNDFLPHIPCIEIICGGMELMFDIYRKIGKKHGYLLRESQTRIHSKAFRAFLSEISTFEQSVLEDKLNGDTVFFPDAIVEKHAEENTFRRTVNIKGYRRDYRRAHFENVEEACQKYIKGLHWVLLYYSGKHVDWNWFYDSHYAPLAYDLAKEKFDDFQFETNEPADPLLQLISILPRRNAKLVPSCLAPLLPEDADFEIDLGGMHQEWEGIALLPFVDRTLLKREYVKKLPLLTDRERKLNEPSRSYVYEIGDTPFTLMTIFGNYPCRTKRSIVIF